MTRRISSLKSGHGSNGKPRVVADTCVFINALVHGQEDALEVLTLEHQGRFLFAFSIKTLDELATLVAMMTERSHFTIDEAFRKLFRAVIRADIIDLKCSEKFCRDPEDDKFVNTAIDGDADYLVSSDGDLLDLSTAGIRTRHGKKLVVCSPKGFLLEILMLEMNRRRLGG